MTDLNAVLRESPFAVKTQTIRAHIADVVRITGVPEEDIIGPKRDKITARARQMVMWKAHKEGHSLPAIGKVLNRHHTSVLHGFRTINRKLGL